MTCLEKYLQDHPDADPKDVIRDVCPHWHSSISLPIPDDCDEDGGACTKCWNRQIPGTEPDPTPAIKDSGERRQFDTGAVRDIQEGKGRCDLMPLDVVANVGDCWDQWHRDVLLLIYKFQCTGCTGHLDSTLNCFGSHVFCDPQTMLLEVAKHFEEGAKKYGEHNWQKGIPVRCYIDSAIRHYLKWLRGDKDEPHDRAFCWNILCAIWTCKHKSELNDYRKENHHVED